MRNQTVAERPTSRESNVWGQLYALRDKLPFVGNVLQL